MLLVGIFLILKGDEVVFLQEAKRPKLSSAEIEERVAEANLDQVIKFLPMSSTGSMHL